MEERWGNGEKSGGGYGKRRGGYGEKIWVMQKRREGFGGKITPIHTYQQAAKDEIQGRPPSQEPTLLSTYGVGG